MIELLDNMYDLVDSLTFRMRAISQSMWPVLEHTYKLFKSDAVDFLDGELGIWIDVHQPIIEPSFRNVAVS